jgi:hypothetical protein
MSACGERKGGRCAHLAFGRRRSKRLFGDAQKLM